MVVISRRTSANTVYMGNIMVRTSVRHYHAVTGLGMAWAWWCLATVSESQCRRNKHARTYGKHTLLFCLLFFGGGLDLVDLFPALGSASVVGAFARCVAPDPNSWDSLTSTTGLRPGHWDEVLVILRIQVHSTLLSISRVLSCTVCCVLSYVFWQHLAKGLHMEFWESIGRSWVSEGKLCSLKHLAGGLGYAATGTS